MPLELTPKQEEAAALFKQHQEVLLEGGSRSGKTLLICAKTLVRAAKYPGTRHLSARLRFNHAKQSLFMGTYREVARMMGAKVKENKSDWYIEVPTAEDPSEIWIGGLDDKERTEKILGTEFATIHINEASQVAFDGYEILKTRLNPPPGVPPLFMIDYNPPSMHHWGFQIFHSGINPGTGAPLLNPELYGKILMNPQDNIKNLSPTYLQTLEGLSEAKKRRFLRGEYTDSAEGAIWNYEWIADHRITSKEVPSLQRVVVAIDPAVTGNDSSDDTGIVIVGSKMIGVDQHFFVLADETYHGEVTGWARRAIDCYVRYDADKVIGEVNNGGDLVEVNIQSQASGRRIPYESVRASRGKAIRAEPVADLYREGRVHHVGTFQDLELQMTHWTPEDAVSPNNMDALVWGVTYLTKARRASRVTLTGRI